MTFQEDSYLFHLPESAAEIKADDEASINA